MNDQEFLSHTEHGRKSETRHPREGIALAQLLSSQPQPGDRPLQAMSLETEELHLKTIRIRHKNETIQSLIARTGISPRQIMDWDLETIGHFVLLAEQRARDEDGAPRNDVSKLLELSKAAERNGRRYVEVGN